MSNIYTADSAGSHHHVGTTPLPAGTGLITDNAIHHHTLTAPETQRGCHRGCRILNAADTGTVTGTPDTAPANSRANNIGSIHLPCHLPS